MLALVNACIPFLRNSIASAESKQYISQVSEYKTLINDSFAPIFQILIVMANLNKRTERVGRLMGLIEAVEVVAQQMTSSHRPRVSVFEVADGHSESPKLQPMKGTDYGRGDQSKTTFEKNSGEGEELWSRLLDSGFSGCADTENQELRPKGWDSKRKREYRSFMSVSIEADDRLYGMLTINSRDSNAFSEDDRKQLQTLAALIALGMRMSIEERSHYYEKQ